MWIKTLALLLTLAPLAQAQTKTLSKPKWQLVWSEEFNRPGKISADKWTFETGGGGWGNHELEHYTDRVANVRQDGGSLIIEAKKENFQGDTFTSGRIHSKRGWKFGRVEVRAKMPGGQGTWPAIWMMPVKPKHSDVVWPDNGELDIMEHVGRDPDQVMSCFYSKNFNWMSDTGKIQVKPLKTATSKFHTYAFEWDENEASYWVDGEKYHVFPNPKTDYKDWPYDQEYYLILNMAVGGFGGDVDPAITSKKFQVDWVRVYQKLNSSSTSVEMQ